MFFDLYLRAQCSPRHACPLPGALLMQVHEGVQAAPVLVRRGVENSLRYNEFSTPVIFRQNSNLIPVICHIFSAQKGFHDSRPKLSFPTGNYAQLGLIPGNRLP